MPDDSHPAIPTRDTPLTRGPWAVVLWGAFLGSSWTWVIGMLFPAMLLRDFGLWGWVVFAVPNVVGAAAMGTVLFRPERSISLVQKHTSACHAFTIVTVGFHLFVVVWLFSRLFGVAAVPMLVAAIGLCAVIGLRNRQTAMLGVAAGATLLSLGCFSYAAQMDGAWSAASNGWTLPDGDATRLTRLDLLLFLPCSVFGFALCPYLDLTFHRARASTTPKTGALAFAFGFGIVFASMIVFSICYGGQLLPMINGDLEAKLPGYWLVVLALHLTLQAGFTVTVHVRESIERPAMNTSLLVGFGGLAIMLGLASRLDSLPASSLTGGLTWGEAGYRAFLLLYGTALPAYVWLMMIPTRGTLTAVGRSARRTIYVATCVSTYALAWIAFVQGRSLAILAIVVIIVVSRLAVDLLPRQR